ncbi:MAG TPA: ABC transporter substrate-binding protein [Anaerolineae bacterium]|nr:ABC transporter substrate-binding protein [Anaerolineae bacterium]
MKKVKAQMVWTLLAAVALVLAACGATAEPAQPAVPTAAPGTTEMAAEPTEAAPAPTTAAAEPAPGEAEPVTLRIGTTYIWDTANPAIGWYNYALRYLLYDTLVEEQGISNLQPGLAESWDVSEDGLVWTFKIREGVTFHDGTPLTAEEVAWSLNWTIENEVETFSFYLANFSEIVALDPTTLQVTLSEPVGNMEYLLMYVWILPRSVWEGMTYDEILEFEDPSAATGTGPYKLVEWVEGEYLILEANEEYWRGAPAIEEVVWQEFATEDAVVQALLAGEIDVVYEVPRTAIQTLEAAENVELAVMKSTVVDELILNSHENGTQPESLNDPAVRLAIAHAIDKQQIINVAFLGYAEAASTIIPTSMGDWHNDAVQDVPFDPAEGNRILDEAGYLDEDGDGLREDADGNPLEYRLYAEDDATETRILEIISDGLAQIGISAPPTPMDEDSLIGLYPDFDFDLIVWGWGLDPDPDFAMLIFTCDQREEGGWSDSGYCDAEFEEMYVQQAVTVDREARRELIWQMQEKLFEDRPYIMLAYEDWVQAYRSDRFTGFGLDAGDITWKSAFLQATPVE